jgi:DNA-binding transcriptional ArsR family regulator
MAGGFKIFIRSLNSLTPQPVKQQNFDVFQVVADPSRRQILRLLLKDSMTINSLAEHFDMSRPAVSKHIKILHGAGFISIQDIGRERHCILKQDGFEKLQEWINYFDKFWVSRLDKLKSLLDYKLKN